MCQRTSLNRIQEYLFVYCEITVFVPDLDWLTPFKWTPSSPKEVMVNVSIQESEPGIFIPVLLIKWKLGTDGTILSMAWSFSLERFVVEPEYTYLVDVYSLPRRNINEYPDQGSMMFVVPGESFHLHGFCLPPPVLLLRNVLHQFRAGCEQEGLSLYICFVPGGKKSIASEDTERPQVVKRVLIVYSLDHVLYKDIVLAFAEFLLTVCGTEVILDLLQTNTISEVGHLNWLAQHKKTSDKIIILCSRGTRAKWTAMLGTEQSQVLLRGDERSPMRDMFTPAMNLIVPDFKKPASFGKYIVAYFDGISEDGDVPDPFNVGVKYKLMKQFEEIHFRVQDLEKYEPGKTYQVPGITSDDYHKHPSGERLRNAIRKFQRYQMEQPDWFEKECLLSAEEAGAEEEEECDRELGDDPSSIRQNVLLLELQDAAGCCVNQLQVADSSHPTFVRCLPTLECRAQITGVSQNVIGMDGVESPALGQTYIREPICCTPVSECNQRVLLSSSLDSPHEEDPLLAAGRVMRNEIVQQASGHAAEDHCVRNDVGCPAPAQSDARQRLAELQQALLLQGLGYSQIPAPEPHHLPESAPFILLPAKEESVESDQGYCSKLYLSAEELHSGRASVLPDALKELEMLQIGLLQESMETAD
uniref:SEFIR domain-containing protein n=1 Tax=Callorhinchus milii TaxID=7868 RepID=A0A4W3J6U5_CALMI